MLSIASRIICIYSYVDHPPTVAKVTTTLDPLWRSSSQSSSCRREPSSGDISFTPFDNLKYFALSCGHSSLTLPYNSHTVAFCEKNSVAKFLHMQLMQHAVVSHGQTILARRREKWSDLARLSTVATCRLLDNSSIAI